MSTAVPPEVVETVARAIHGAGWSDSTKHGPQYASFDAFMEHLARAAIAALPPSSSPAEEAVKGRAVALVDALIAVAPVMRFDNDYPVKAVPVAQLLDLRAALAVIKGDPS